MDGRWRDNKQARIRRAVEAAERQLERDLIEERADSAAKFHNGIVALIDEQRPSVETILYVTELLRWQLMAQRQGQNFGPGEHVHTHDNGASAAAIGIS